MKESISERKKERERATFRDMIFIRTEEDTRHTTTLKRRHGEKGAKK